MKSTLFLTSINEFIKHPKSSWDQIQLNYFNHKFITYNFLLPLIFIASLITIIGRFTNLRDFSAINAILAFVSYFIINFSAIYFSVWIINELVSKFNVEKNFNSVFVLIAFSSFPTILSESLSELHQSLSFLHLISIYSIVLFWIGTNIILKIPKELQTGFTIICVIIIAAVSLITRFLTMSFFLLFF